MIKKYITLFLLGIFLSSSPLALAAREYKQPEYKQPEYKPPKDKKPPSGYTRATGSRGYKGQCQVNSRIPLTLLAPYTHVGETASEHPTFAWYVPVAEDVPIELSIYQENDRKRPELVQKLTMKTTPGIMKAVLPKNQAGLDSGKRYIWQVAILCNPNRPSSDLVASAEIDVVTKSSADGKYSLWYDALSASLTGSKTTELNRSAKNLLSQLAELEKQQGEKGSDRGAHLLEIINSQSLANSNSQSE